MDKGGIPLQRTIFREVISSAAAGGFVDSFFYSLDSYKTRLQSGTHGATCRLQDLRGLFRGFLPVVLTGSAPSFAVFFATYAPLKQALSSSNPNVAQVRARPRSARAGAGVEFRGRAYLTP